MAFYKDGFLLACKSLPGQNRWAGRAFLASSSLPSPTQCAWHMENWVFHLTPHRAWWAGQWELRGAPYLLHAWGVLQMGTNGGRSESSSGETVPSNVCPPCVPWQAWCGLSVRSCGWKDRGSTFCSCGMCWTLGCCPSSLLLSRPDS